MLLKKTCTDILLGIFSRTYYISVTWILFSRSHKVLEYLKKAVYTISCERIN